MSVGELLIAASLVAWIVFAVIDARRSRRDRQERRNG